MRAFSDATGATALRGDSTSIIQSYTRLDQGPEPVHHMQKRAPLHTVALALARSRAAAIARQFKGVSSGRARRFDWRIRSGGHRRASVPIPPRIQPVAGKSHARLIGVRKRPTAGEPNQGFAL
jgi:hypothetical protein